jgi:hypothetical protein
MKLLEVLSWTGIGHRERVAAYRSAQAVAGAIPAYFQGDFVFGTGCFFG